jgi:hypothetical protein
VDFSVKRKLSACTFARFLGGKPHIEAAGLTANASERFLAAMEEMGYAPDSYKTLPQ